VTPIAEQLAAWAHKYQPTRQDVELAQRSLVDTVAVALAARNSPLTALVGGLPAAARWSAAGHALDYDDLHIKSTTHVSAVCVPATLATRGDAHAYLVGAGVMTRLGTALGWNHYSRGWHATCTAGAPAAAVTASLALGLSTEQTAAAMALAVPAAGGVQRAFGSEGKSLQVGFAAAAGVRAARLAAAGATSDPSALDQWLGLVGGDASAVDLDGPAVPGGLAIKVFPCCYALQRPISATQHLRRVGVYADDIQRITVTTPEGTVQPLIYHHPKTGLQAKFSLEYAVAAALLDEYPGFDSFTDPFVLRSQAQQLIGRIDTILTPGGDHLLAGEALVTAYLRDGSTRSERLQLPPGSPRQPPTASEFAAKLAECGPDVPGLLSGINWASAAMLLAEAFPPTSSAD
jgi:2-methylcitrate dehydratase PrpD